MSATTETVATRAARAGGNLLRHVRSTLDPTGARPSGAQAPASGWLAVTVMGDPQDIEAAALPVPLAELGDRIEVRVRPAPDGKGTELGARLREQESSGNATASLSGSDAQADLRSALRQAKQLLEVGEVLAVDPAPHGERTATPGGAFLEAWTKVAPKAGVR
jgi:hypothetical protein